MDLFLLYFLSLSAAPHCTTPAPAHAMTSSSLQYALYMYPWSSWYALLLVTDLPTDPVNAAISQWQLKPLTIKAHES